MPPMTLPLGASCDVDGEDWEDPVPGSGAMSASLPVRFKLLGPILDSAV